MPWERGIDCLLVDQALKERLASGMMQAVDLGKRASSNF